MSGVPAAVGAGISVCFIAFGCWLSTPGIVHNSCATCRCGDIADFWLTGAFGEACSVLALVDAYWSKSYLGLRIARSAFLANIGMLAVSLGFIWRLW